MVGQADSTAMKLLPVLSIVLVATFLLSCLAVMNTAEPLRDSELSQFTSDEEMRYYITSHAEERGTGQFEAVNEADTAATSGYSRTTVQEEGVDESDIIKTDGSTLFLAEGNRVHLIATTPSLSNITDIVIGSATEVIVDGLYLTGERLVAIYSTYEQAYPGGTSDGAVAIDVLSLSSSYISQTCINVYDVSDPAHPSLLLSGGVSGYTTTSRMVGSVVYLITEQSVWIGGEIAPPQVWNGTESQDVPASSISYDPGCTSVSTFVNVLALDVSDGSRSNLTALAGYSSICYMSPGSLYLTMPRWEGAVSNLITSSPGSLTTTIYRIAVDGTSMVLVAQGSVEGGPLNQFALDEHEGRLRVATTSWGGNLENQVHVLDMGLREVGVLKGIAPGETIYSARYMGDRLYLVTYEQVDPLFIIDLSADTPKVLGELKVPGASTYLQMTEDGLMGIGFENGSVKVSLYNVTDPAHMSEIDTYLVEGFSYSPAQYDHHAVLYDASRKVLVIPITSYTNGAWSEAWYYQRPLSVALVLDVDESGIGQRGAITHKDATVIRSVYIGDVLYTISDTMVKANSLSTLAPLGTLIYSQGQDYYGWYSATVRPAMAE